MAETRIARFHLLGRKHADANHDAWPLEEFLSADFPRYPGRLDSLWGKIHGTYIYTQQNCLSLMIITIDI